MADFLQNIRTHFNVMHREDYLSLTLINPNISAQVMTQIRQHFKLMNKIEKQEIIIIQTPNFDDQLLTILAQSLPISLKQLTLDFTGCESIKGPGFLELFEKISKMEKLTKLHFDFSQIYEINDFVIEGISMLLQMLVDLKQFYLDLYEIDQVTQDGYLILAESISNAKNIQKLHIDLSANVSLTQDALELMFYNLSPNITCLGFRILDIQQIGGGSFFKLAQSICQMKNLTQLNLTISTFSNLNQKGIFSIIKAISSSKSLKNLQLNLSNINLPERILSYFSFPSCLEHLSLDVSCNGISDRDIVALCQKIPTIHVLKSISLNVDFCKKISQSSIETLLERVCQNKSLMKISLPDRKYSQNFINRLIQLINNSKCNKPMIMLSCPAVQIMQKVQGLEKLKLYKQNQKIKRNIVFSSLLIKRNKKLENFQKDILQVFLP